MGSKTFLAPPLISGFNFYSFYWVTETSVTFYYAILNKSTLQITSKSSQLS